MEIQHQMFYPKMSLMFHHHIHHGLKKLWNKGLMGAVGDHGCVATENFHIGVCVVETVVSMCGHQCPFGEFCFFGMCGYGMGSSPFHPTPLKQKQPKPPQIPYIPSHHYPAPPNARKEEF
ncbi:hypothetical protein TSUD_130010 [Trifolium subterraneum]|nr:hypothetical protein TSUD_130010 [Trifolium subterraneum]